jgi:hypothetical protein
MIESISNFFQAFLSLSASAFQQVHNRQIKVGHIAVMPMALVELLKTVSASIELAFVKERSRQRDALCVRGTSGDRKQAKAPT